MPVKAIHSTDLDVDKEPGSFQYFTRHADELDVIAGMIFICPCGCGSERLLDFRPHKSPSWEWDGNHVRPTLYPSVNGTTGCKWHGCLKKGMWISV